MDRKTFLDITRSAFRKWLAHNASLRAAALAYFIILPLPLLLLIILAILTLIYGQAEAFQTLIQQITTIAGPTVADLMRQLLESVTSPFTSLFASVTSLVFTIIGAIGIFGVLQNTMDTIWGVNQHKSGFLQRIKRKIVPFLLISVLGFAIMVWTGITAVLLRILTYALNPLSSTTVTVTLRITQFGLSFVLATLLFAVIYKEIPDLAIQWRDVSSAAIITSLLFTMTNSLIGIIIEFFTITSVTGAAGSLMILLPWIFLINQFTLYGAAFSKVYTETVGSYSQKRTET